jgi:hypothetical protein
VSINLSTKRLEFSSSTAFSFAPSYCNFKSIDSQGIDFFLLPMFNNDMDFFRFTQMSKHSQRTNRPPPAIFISSPSDCRNLTKSYFLLKDWTTFRITLGWQPSRKPSTSRCHRGFFVTRVRPDSQAPHGIHPTFPPHQLFTPLRAREEHS